MNFNGLIWQQPISNGREWIFHAEPGSIWDGKVVHQKWLPAGALAKAQPRPPFENSENLTWTLFSVW